MSPLFCLRISPSVIRLTEHLALGISCVARPVFFLGSRSYHDVIFLLSSSRFPLYTVIPFRVQDSDPKFSQPKPKILTLPNPIFLSTTHQPYLIQNASSPLPLTKQPKVKLHHPSTQSGKHTVSLKQTSTQRLQARIPKLTYTKNVLSRQTPYLQTRQIESHLYLFYC